MTVKQFKKMMKRKRADGEIGRVIPDLEAEKYFEDLGREIDYHPIMPPRCRRG